MFSGTSGKFTIFVYIYKYKPIRPDCKPEAKDFAAKPGLPAAAHLFYNNSQAVRIWTCCLSLKNAIKKSKLGV